MKNSSFIRTASLVAMTGIATLFANCKKEFATFDAPKETETGVTPDTVYNNVTYVKEIVTGDASGLKNITLIGNNDAKIASFDVDPAGETVATHIQSVKLAAPGARGSAKNNQAILETNPEGGKIVTVQTGLNAEGKKAPIKYTYTTAATSATLNYQDITLATAPETLNKLTGQMVNLKVHNTLN